MYEVIAFPALLFIPVPETVVGNLWNPSSREDKANALPLDCSPLQAVHRLEMAHEELLGSDGGAVWRLRQKSRDSKPEYQDPHRLARL